MLVANGGTRGGRRWGENVFVDVNGKPNLALDGAIQKLGGERILIHGFGTEEAEISKLTYVKRLPPKVE